jgi:hypothetical protein
MDGLGSAGLNWWVGLGWVGLLYFACRRIFCVYWGYANSFENEYMSLSKVE